VSSQQSGDGVRLLVKQPDEDVHQRKCALQNSEADVLGSTLKTNNVFIPLKNMSKTATQRLSYYAWVAAKEGQHIITRQHAACSVRRKQINKCAGDHKTMRNFKKTRQLGELRVR
jgi:hypothetical protein